MLSIASLVAMTFGTPLVLAADARLGWIFLGTTAGGFALCLVRWKVLRRRADLNPPE